MPNCPMPNCPGAKLSVFNSWCQIVRYQIVLQSCTAVFICYISNFTVVYICYIYYFTVVYVWYIFYSTVVFYMIYILLYIIKSSCLPIYLYFRSRLLKSNIFSLLSKIEFLQRHTWSLLCVTFGYLCDIFCCLPSSKYICYLQNPDDETIKNGQ